MDTQERTIDNIRKAQASQGVQLRITLPSAVKPKLLLLGCVDARLNPRDDIGIPDGDAVIHRTIAAVVPEYNPKDETSVEFNKVITETIANGIKDVAVMGHTYCGGLDGCLKDNHMTLPYVREHIKPIMAVREQAHGIEDKEQRHVTMEDRSVAQIIANIKTYPVVQQAMARGDLNLHGWVIHTGTRRIREMDMAHPAEPFKPMEILETKPANSGVIDLVRFKQGEVVKENRHAPSHKPEMVIFGDMDAEINPANDLSIPYGKAIIYRDAITTGEDLPLGKKATLQFGIEAMHVKDVVVLGHYDSRKPEENMEKAQIQVRRRVERLKKFLSTQPAMQAAQVHGWVYDNAMHPPRIFEMDSQQVFKPMASPECKSPVVR